jgi:hypothetical protein
MYWQYTTAAAFSVLAPTNPAASSAANAIGSFMLTPPFGSPNDRM